MALELILGPAHAGKIAELYARYLAALDSGRDVVLVVPDAPTRRGTVREILARRPAVLGLDVVTFDEVALRILERTDAARPLLAGQARSAVLRRCFARDADRLAPRFDRLGSALLDPAAVAAAGEDDLAARYAVWWEELDRIGMIDGGRLRIEADRALRTSLAAWPAGAELFAQGFDDLSAAQEALVMTVAERARAVLSLPYEAGRPIFAALAPAVARLADRAGSEGILELPVGDQGRAAGLVALERRLAEPDPDRRADDPLGADCDIVEVEGERAEAQAVVGIVAAALRDGFAGSRIAVIAPYGTRDRQHLADALRGIGIAVDDDAPVALSATPFGRALLAYLRIMDGDADDADRLVWLRSPWSGAPAMSVERGERLVRRALDDLRGAIDRGGAVLRDALAPPSSATADDARAQAEAAVREMLRRAHGLGAIAPSAAFDADLAVARSALRILADPAIIALRPDREEVRSLLSGVTAVTPAVEADAVRIVDLRGARTLDLDLAVVIGLEEPLIGVGGDPAGDEMVGGPAADDVALHLLSMAVTRPRHRLVLMRRTADDDGSPLAPSALWEVLRTARGTGGVERRRRFADVVYDLGEAPAERERVRALAALAAYDPGRARAAAGRLGLRDPLERALGAHRATTRLRDPRVLEEIRARSLIGVTEVDRFGECSQIWFVERRLQPVELDQPIDDRRRMGTLAHTVLARLYREVPARLGTISLGPEQAALLPAEIERLVDEEAAKLRPADEQAALALRLAVWGLRRDLTRLAVRAARAGSPLQPTAFEVQFGGRGAQAGFKQGLNVGPAAVSGKIDRIDADPFMTARAIVVDYKSGSVQGADAIRSEGRLQIPLYLLALREVLGREPVGGVYVSVRRGETRGIVDGEQEDVLPGGIVPSDRLGHEAFEEALEAARAEAGVRIERMRAGDVRHDPRDRRLCEEFCDYAGICRVAR